MVDFARSTTSSRSSLHAPVDRYFQPSSAMITTMVALARRRNGAGALHGARHRGARGDAREEPEFGEPTRPLDGLARTHDHLAIEQLLAVVVGERSAARSRRPGCAVRRPSRHSAARPPRSAPSGFCSLRKRPTPMSVPDVPSPATKCVISGTSRQISGPVVVVVRPGVGRVRVLVEEDPLGVLGAQGLGAGEPRRSSLRCRVSR